MWTLGRLLPVVIGHMVPIEDPHWIHYLQLLEIMDFLFVPMVRSIDPGYVEVLIDEHLSEFTSLYSGESVLPKMHFTVHMAHYLHM